MKRSEKHQKLIDSYCRLAWATLITLLMLIMAHSGRAEELALVFVDNHEYATEISINNYGPTSSSYRPFPGFGNTVTVPPNSTIRFSYSVSGPPRFGVMFLDVPAELVIYSEVRHNGGELVRVPPVPKIEPGGPEYQYLDLLVDGRSEVYVIAPAGDANVTVTFHDIHEGKPRARSYQLTAAMNEPLVVPVIATRATIQAGWFGFGYANAPIYSVARTGGETVIPRPIK